MDRDIIIPQNISFYGLLSGQVLLLCVFIGFFCKHYLLCVFGIILYITTMLHWSNLRNDKIMYLDIFFVITTILIITFYYAFYFFKKNYRNIWFIVLSLTTIIFSLNEYFYLNFIVNNKIIENKDFIMKINVLIHILFLHILLPFTYIYCSVLSL
jgi:hypothetical protein